MNTSSQRSHKTKCYVTWKSNQIRSENVRSTHGVYLTVCKLQVDRHYKKLLLR